MPHIVVIGGGNMGLAIVRGALATGTLAGHVIIAEPNPARPMPDGCISARTAKAALNAGPADAAIVLAVKPQVYPEVVRELGPASGRGRLVISVMAGVPIAKLAAEVDGRVIRVMPNLPVSVGQGMSAICPGPAASAHDVDYVRVLFAALGKATLVPEALMDAFTAVAGSGPAYLFYLVEAMTAGAEAAGIPAVDAEIVARQTIIGAAELLKREPGTPPAELRARVTSKGGTTAAATGVLDTADFNALMTRAILAARDRGRELSR